MGFRDIFDAAENGTVEDVKYFIEEKGVDANTRRYDIADSRLKGETPLFGAACYGNIEVAKYLISKGANVNAKDDKGFTPLFITVVPAIKSEHNTGKFEVAKLLISNGANVNARDNDKWTPLHAAMQSKDTEIVNIVKVLIENGASINARTAKKNTPLDCAEQLSNTVMQQYLVSKGAMRGATIGKIIKWVAIGVGILLMIAMCSTC